MVTKTGLIHRKNVKRFALLVSDSFVLWLLQIRQEIQAGY